MRYPGAVQPEGEYFCGYNEKQPTMKIASDDLTIVFENKRTSDRRVVMRASCLASPLHLNIVREGLGKA